MQKAVRVNLGNISRETLAQMVEVSGMPVSEFAQALGVTRESVSRYLSGKLVAPRPILLASILIAQQCMVPIIFENPLTSLTPAVKKR